MSLMLFDKNDPRKNGHDQDGATGRDIMCIIRMFVQMGLPHRIYKQDTFTRVNGRESITIQSGVIDDGKMAGIPYGTYPRLLNGWLTTCAVRTNTRHIEIPMPIKQLARDIQVTSGCIQTNVINELLEQSEKLLASKLSYLITRNGVIETHRMLISDFAKFYKKGPTVAEVSLSDTYFKSIIANPVPINFQVLRRLAAGSKSALCMDLFVLLSYETFKINQYDGRNPQRYIPFVGLMDQLGTHYDKNSEDGPKNFGREVRKCLGKVLKEHPFNIKISNKSGIIVFPCQFLPVKPKDYEF